MILIGNGDSEESYFGVDGYITDPTNRDTDDDGLNDYDEIFVYGTNPTNNDTDSDGYDDKYTFLINETTGLRTNQTGDAFPLDKNECNDTDSDGVGDNSDAFPLDSNESKDSDGDMLGDNTEDSNGNGKVDVGETDYQNNDTDSDGRWNLSVIQDLHFSDMPVATPTPTPIPPTLTPTPVIIQPSFISGEIVSGSSGDYAGAGLKLYAVINDYTSETVEIEEGLYKIVIDPKYDYYIGEEIEFILEGIKALTTHRFVAGEFNKEVNLIFPSIPATPVPPTPTSIPPTPKPSVPEPTRTPVPAVIDKIIVEVTSTPTPTPLPVKEEKMPEPTSETQSIAMEEEINGGGACGANIDPNAPVSSGHIAMLLTPLLFIGFRKISGKNH